jgi:hypothetical protein
MNKRLQEIKRKAMTFNQELREIDLEEHIDWLIQTVKELQERNEELNDNEEGYLILADVREILLPFVDSKDSPCNDMLVCTVSNPNCIKCLAEQIIKQLQQAQVKAEKYENVLREIDTHIRSTSEPVSYIIQTLKETLPEYTEQTLEGEK